MAEAKAKSKLESKLESKQLIDHTLGVLQCPLLTQEEHDMLATEVLSTIEGWFEHVLVQKLEKPKHSDVDICHHHDVNKEKILRELFPGARMNVNGSCISVEIKGFQVDFITVEHPEMGVLFYTCGISLPLCFLFRGTPFSLSTTAFSIKTEYGTFVLSQEPQQICAFLGISLEVLHTVRTPDELFGLVRTSWLYDPAKILDVDANEKDMRRVLMKQFRHFCEANPNKGIVLSFEEAIIFFGREAAYAEFLCVKQEEKRQKELKDARDQKVAAIKQVALPYFKGKNITGKVLGERLDAFKIWIEQKEEVVSYEEWAQNQTKSDVEEALKHFMP